MATICVAAGTFVALVACSSTDPKLATGAAPYQNITPPVEIQQSDMVPPIYTSCDTSGCSVSWTKQIFPILQSTGAGQCASGTCHGGTQAPAILDADSMATYNALTDYHSKALGRRYVQPCASPSQSGILCNLQTPPSCGSPMPINGIAPLSSTQIDLITQWLQCGAPNN